MRKCPYCTAENRDEAIFCSHCRRPLPNRPSPPRIALVWLLAVIALVGFGSYLFSSRLLPGAPILDSMATAGPVPTHTREPVVLPACVEQATKIRRGPGTHYETIGGLPSGTCLTILGRNEDASWVYMISDDDLTGWIAATTLTDTGDISRISVRDDSAMVNPARPTLTSAEIANGAEVYLTRVSATNQAHAPLSEYVEPCFEAVNEIGEQISCRLEKAYCDYLPEVEGKPTVCVDRPAPDHTFALVAFDRDWSDLDGQCLIISGYLEVDWGMMQIQALHRNQVSSCE